MFDHVICTGLPSSSKAVLLRICRKENVSDPLIWLPSCKYLNVIVCAVPDNLEPRCRNKSSEVKIPVFVCESILTLRNYG